MHVTFVLAVAVGRGTRFMEESEHVFTSLLSPGDGSRVIFATFVRIIE